jgi:hypothetical protein
MIEKNNSLWKVLIEFLVATNPHLSHSPTTETRKKKINMESVDQIFGHN